MCDKEFNGTANYPLATENSLCNGWQLIFRGSCWCQLFEPSVARDTMDNLKELYLSLWPTTILLSFSNTTSDVTTATPLSNITCSTPCHMSRGLLSSVSHQFFHCFHCSNALVSRKDTQASSSILGREVYAPCYRLDVQYVYWNLGQWR